MKHVPVTRNEVLVLIVAAIEAQDAERVEKWADVLLSSNDPPVEYLETADA